MKMACVAAGLSMAIRDCRRAGVSSPARYSQQRLSIRGSDGASAGSPWHTAQAGPASGIPSRHTKRPDAAPGSETSIATRSNQDPSLRFTAMGSSKRNTTKPPSHDATGTLKTQGALFTPPQARASPQRRPALNSARGRPRRAVGRSGFAARARPRSRRSRDPRRHARPAETRWPGPPRSWRS